MADGCISSSGYPKTTAARKLAKKVGIRECPALYLNRKILHLGLIYRKHILNRTQRPLEDVLISQKNVFFISDSL